MRFSFGLLTRSRKPRAHGGTQRVFRCLESLETRVPLAAEGTDVVINQSFNTAGLVGNVAAEVRWGDGTTSQNAGSGGSTNGRMRFAFDYTYDGGFFSGGNQWRRQLLETAANSITSRLNDTLNAVPSSNRLGWEISGVPHPSQNGTITIPGQAIPSDTILVYIGAKDLGISPLGGPILGLADSRVPSATFNQNVGPPLTQSELDSHQANLRNRGEYTGLFGSPLEYAPAVGIVTFDSDTDWHFGATPASLDTSEVDFISTATHELLHILGFGVELGGFSTPWGNYSNGSTFSGPQARQYYGGNVPVIGAHLLDGTTDNGRLTVMTPTLEAQAVAERVYLTELELRMLDDLGWDILPTQVNVNASHAYPDDGTYDAEVILRGSQSGEVTYSLPFDIDNVSPAVTGTSIGNVIVGQAASLRVEVSDPGYAGPSADPPSTETFTYTIDWKDGTPVGSGDLTITQAGNATRPTQAALNLQHTYEEPGTYDIAFTIEDDDGGMVSQNVRVVVMDTPSLSLSLSQHEIAEDEGDAAVTLTVSRPPALVGSPLTVTLLSSDTSEAQVQTSVNMAANERTVDVPIDIVDDSLLDGDQTVTFTASASDYVGDQTQLMVTDRETLSAAFVDGVYAEDTAADSIQLRVTVSGNATTDVPIVLSGGAGRVAYGNNWEIPANQNFVLVTLSPVDDVDEQAMEAITLNVSVPGTDGATASFLLQDDENEFQNAGDRYNVNGQDDVTALDALIIINAINRAGGEYPVWNTERQNGDGFWDVNGDYRISAIDILQVINELNRRGLASEPNGEAVAGRGAFDSLNDVKADDDLEHLIDLIAANASGGLF